MKESAPRLENEPRAKKSGKTRPRRWWRWPLRILMGLVLLVVVLRVAIHFAIPYVAEAVCASLGLRVEFEQIRLTLLSLRVELQDVALYASNAKEGAPPLLKLDKGDVRFDLDALLDSGTIRFPWAELDGVELGVCLEPGRMVTLWDRIAEYGAQTSAAEESGDSTVSATAIAEAAPNATDVVQRVDLTLPVEIGSVRIQHLDILFEDRRPGMEFETRLLCNLVGKNLGSRVERNRLTLGAASPNLLEALRLDVDGISGPGILDARVGLHIAEFEPVAMQKQLQRTGLWPEAHDVALEFQAAVDLHPRSAEEPGSEGTIAVEKLILFMDNERTFDLGRLDAGVTLWKKDLFHVGSLVLDGLRSRVGILDGGQVSVAGVSLLDAAPDTGAVATVRPSVPTPASSDPGAVVIDGVRIEDLQVAFRDDAARVAQDLRLAKASLRGLALGGSDPPPAIVLDLDLALPGSVETWKLTGIFEPKGKVRHLSLDSRMSGLTLGKLAPYLVAAGLQPELAGGELRFGVKGTLESLAQGGHGMALSLQDLELSDGKDLVVLDSLEVKGLEDGVEPGLRKIQEVGLAGLGLEVVRDEKDRIHVLGMRLLSGSAVGPAKAGPGGKTPPGPRAKDAPAVGVDPADTATRWVLDRLVARDSWVHLSDRSKRARLQDIHGAWSADIKHVDLGATDAAAPPLEFDLRVSARDLLDRLDLAGQMRRKGRGHDLFMDLAGRGLHGKNLEPWLDTLGLSPEFELASLSLRMEAEGLGVTGALPGKVRLSGIRFKDGDRSLFEMSSLEVLGLAKSSGGTQIDSVAIKAPSLELVRDEEGMLHVAGVRIQPVVPGAGTDTAVAPPPVADERGVEAKKASTTPDPSPSFSLKKLQLDGGRLVIQDRFQREKPGIPIDLTLALSDLSLAPMGASVHWDLAVSIRDNLDELRVRGDLDGKKGLSAELEVAAKGIRGAILSDYLPERVSMDMANGRLVGHAELDLESGDQGPKQVRAELKGWRLDDDGKSLWQLDELVLRASRVDVGREAFKVEEFTTKGHEISVTRDAQRRMRALGLVVELPKEGAPEVPAPKATPEGDHKKAVARVDRMRSLQQPFEMMAPIHLGVVALGLDRIRFHDLSVEGSVPVEGHLRIRNLEPIDLVPTDFDEMPREVIKVEASFLPIVKKLDIELTTQVWNVMPELDMSIRAEGIRGEGLTEVFPGLKEKIHGRELTDGTFKADMRLVLQLRRASRTEFPFENGFGFDFDLTGVEFRDKPQGRILAGLDLLEIQLRRYEARTGQTWIRAVNIETPRARIDRTEDGIVMGGICFLQPNTLPTAETKPLEVETVPASRLQVQQSAPAKAVPSEPGREGSQRIDSATISGFDFVYRDLRANPPTVLPITGMEGEVKNYSRGDRDASRPTTFEFHVDGGMVEFPKRPLGKGLIGGIVSTATGVVSKDKAKVTLEKRPVFDELSLKGSLYTTPKVTGQIELDLGALELLTFKSIAKRRGVDIQDGVLDLHSTMEIGGDDQIQVSLYPVFTFLGLHEPKDGFLSNLLALPAPLDTTLFLTQNSRGEHVYPLSFELKRGQISAGQIRSMVIGALSRSLTTMVTSSPFRILGGVTSIVGLDINARNTTVGKALKLEFGAGQVSPTQNQVEQLHEMVRVLQGDANLDIRIMQRSGKQDWDYASRIANPSRKECLALAKGMVQKRRVLARKRSSLSKRLLSLYDNGRTAEAEKGSVDLKQLDIEIGQLEASMDEIFTHLRPGAERQKDRRTRAANHEIAMHRIENVKAELIRIGGDSLSDRIETIRPRSRKDDTLPVGEVLLIQRRRVGR